MAQCEQVDRDVGAEGVVRREHRAGGDEAVEAVAAAEGDVVGDDDVAGSRGGAAVEEPPASCGVRGRPLAVEEADPVADLAVAHMLYYSIICL